MAFDGTLKFDTAIDKTGFKLGLDNLGSLAAKGMAAVTAAVTAAAGAVSALGGYAVSVGKDFESSMAQVIATMGITKDTVQDGVNSYDLLKEAAAAAGESTTFSASEAADALNYLALAGYDAAKAADALPAVLDLAAAGGLDLAYASDLATDAMAALGIEATSDNLTRFGDEMAKTASKANTSVAQLGEAILTVGGTAKSLAGGTTELNAALGVLANRGIKGAEGGTALRNMILALSAPTDKAAEAMANLGLEVFDAAGNMRPMNEIFKDLDTALAGMSEGEKTQVLNEIFNKVDLKSAQAMLAGCGEEFDSLTDALGDCDGAMSAMADTMNDTLEGDLKSLNSKMEAFGIAIYDNLNEPLRELAQLGSDYISQLTAAFKEGGFEGLAESLGDVLGQAITKISEYLPAILEMGASVVENLINGLVFNIDGISQSASQIMLTIVNSAVSILPELLVAGAEIITSLVEGMAKSAPQLSKAAIEGIGRVLDGISANLPAFIEAALEIISAVLSAVADNIDVILDAALEMLETLAMSLVENIEPLIEAVIEIIFAIAEYISENSGEIASVAVTVITTLAGCIIEHIPDFIAALAALFVALVNYQLTLFDEWISYVQEFFVDVIDDVGAWFSDIKDGVSEWIEQIADDIKEWFSDLIDNAGEAASDFIDAIVDFFKELPGNISDFLSDAVDEVAEWGENLIKKGKEAAKDLVDTVVEGISSLPDKLWEAGKQLVEGLWEGIKSAAGWLGDKISDFGSGIIDDFKDVFGIHSPSRVMRDSVGKYLAQGVGEGFTDELPDVGKEAVKTFTSIKFTPDIDPEAVRALELQGNGMSGIVQSSPTSEIVNNQYSYSTVNNNNNSETSSDLSGNIQIFIGEEMAAEIALDKIDKKQGQKIQLRKRGLA